MIKISEYPLTPEQLHFYNIQKEYPLLPAFNMYPMLMKLKDWVDMKKMSAAIIKTAQAHPACFSLVEEHNGTVFQKYVPDLITDVKIEKNSEAEFQAIAKNLIQPFNLLKEPGFRFRLFETESAKYFFIDTHHVFCDGLAKCIFVYDLDKVYAGQEIEQDAWLSYLEQRENAKLLPHYRESKLYYENLYGDAEWSKYPKTDFEGNGKNEQGFLFRDIDFSDNDWQILREYNLTQNDFFIIVSLLSTAIFNNSENVMNKWTYKGRWTKQHRNIIGNMIMKMPVALKLKNMTISQIFKSVREQVKGSLSHRDYSYIHLDKKILEDDILCSTYQSDLYSVPSKINLFESMAADLETNGYNVSDNIMYTEFRNQDKQFFILFDYAAHKYKSETVDKFFDTINKCAHKLLKVMKENKCDSEAIF